MKTKVIFAVMALMLCSFSMAQEDSAATKKKGGFMKALKKGIESTTGLRVSDETLFVYPTIGDWKMQLASCVGDKETGNVQIKIWVTCLNSKNRHASARCLITEANVTGVDKALELHSFSADPLYDFKPNKAVEATFGAVYDVPRDAKSLDIKFYIDYRHPETIFEARRVPIEWR